MITVRVRVVRRAGAGTVTLIGGVAGTVIEGIRMSISGIVGTSIDGIVTRRVPIVPGRMIFPSGFFSGVSVTVRVL